MKRRIQLAITATCMILGISASASAADAPAASGVQVHAGQMLYDSSEHRIAAVYRVTADGNVQIVLNGKLVTAPASSLSDVNGKLTTSLSKSELSAAR